MTVWWRWPLDVGRKHLAGILAAVAGHLTPELLRREIDKLPADLPVWIYHVKPQFYDEIAGELARIDAARLTILEQDKTYTI